MNNEQKEAVQQNPAPEQKEEVKKEVETSASDLNSKILEALDKINERIVSLEEKTKDKEVKVSEEDVFKSLKAQAAMMQNQFKSSLEAEKALMTPEQKIKELSDSTNFAFNNGVYSAIELQQEFDNPYLAYNRNSYIFRKFFEQTGIKPRFENVEELTRYYSNKNKLNPLSYF